MDEVQGPVEDRVILGASDATWERAVRVAAVIGPLADRPSLGGDPVDCSAGAPGGRHRIPSTASRKHHSLL